MHLVVLRSIFAMVSVGIAVIMFNSEPMKAADEWVPWAVLGVMVVLPVTVIGLDSSIKSKNLSVITAVYFGPEINYTWSDKLSAELGVDLPVSTTNTALQLVPDWRVRAAVTWHF